MKSEHKAGTIISVGGGKGEFLRFIDSLDERVFGKTSKNAWKLRMFFKPAAVVSYLVSSGPDMP